MILIGGIHVGKTSIALRYCEDVFKTHTKHTVGTDVHVKEIEIDDKLIKVGLIHFVHL